MIYIEEYTIINGMDSLVCSLPISLCDYLLIFCCFVLFRTIMKCIGPIQLLLLWAAVNHIDGC